MSLAPRTKEHHTDEPHAEEGHARARRTRGAEAKEQIIRLSTLRLGHRAATAPDEWSATSKLSEWPGRSGDGGHSANLSGDIAEFMLRQLSEDTYVRKMPAMMH